VARACVNQVALYGYEVWKKSYKPQVGLVQKVDKPLRQAARAIVPSYRTTQLATLHRESGVLPAALEIARRQERWQLRLAASPTGPCQAWGRLEPGGRGRPAKTNLTRLWEGAPRPQRRVLPAPEFLLPTSLKWPAKELQVAAVKEKASSSQYAMVYYTDGSKSERYDAGWAVSAWQKGKEVASVSGKLRKAEVFDAEVVALAVALSLAGPRSLVLSDSQAAIRAVHKGDSPSSQLVVRRAHEALRKGLAQVDWCPAHKEVPGNERADKLAKAATGPEVEPRGQLTYAHAKAELRRAHELRTTAWWVKARPARYESLGLGPKPDALGTPRPLMGKIVAHRSGHGPFVSYLKRFQKEGLPRHSCGTPQEPQHLSYCPKLEPHRRELKKLEKTAKTTAALYKLMVGATAWKYFPKE